MAKKIKYECDICGASCPKDYKILFPDSGLFVLVKAYSTGGKVDSRTEEDRMHVCGQCVKDKING